MGVGWSAEEFAALGVPFARRGRRTAEYVAALRTLWRDDVGSFAGEFVRFDGIRVYPKPVARRRLPVVVGGNSDAALRRVAAIGDGWYGFNVDGRGGAPSASPCSPRPAVRRAGRPMSSASRWRSAIPTRPTCRRSPRPA